MASPLLSLPATIHKAFRNVFFDATLYRDAITSNSPDIDSFDPPAPTTTEYECKAIVEVYGDRYRTDSTISEKDRKVLILAQSISVTPRPGDRVLVDGTGVTFTLLDIATDPSTSVWECRGQM